MAVSSRPAGRALPLASARLLHDRSHPPALVLAERTGLGDHDAIADRAAVLLVVRLILRAALHVLLVHRVLHQPLDDDHDGLVHLVADDDALAGLGSTALHTITSPARRARARVGWSGRAPGRV